MQWIKHLTRATLITTLLATGSLVSAAEKTVTTPASNAQTPATNSAQTSPSATAQNAATSAVGKVNINSASAAELSTLNGIGNVKAEAIVRFREEHGPFNSVDDLTAVKGIGQATLDKNRDLVVVN